MAGILQLASQMAAKAEAGSIAKISRPEMMVRKYTQSHCNKF